MIWARISSHSSQVRVDTVSEDHSSCMLVGGEPPAYTFLNHRTTCHGLTVGMSSCEIDPASCKPGFLKEPTYVRGNSEGTMDNALTGQRCESPSPTCDDGWMKQKHSKPVVSVALPVVSAH